MSKLTDRETQILESWNLQAAPLGLHVKWHPDNTASGYFSIRRAIDDASIWEVRRDHPDCVDCFIAGYRKALEFKQEG